MCAGENGKKGCKCLQKRPTIVLKSQEKNKLRLRIRHSNCLVLADGKFAFPDLERRAALLGSKLLLGQTVMIYKETFWMACDSTEQLRAEYGPFHTRAEAEREADKLGFGFILRYEHMIGENDDIKEVRCIFIELQPELASQSIVLKLHTRCATCGETSIHDHAWQAEVWADIHEFEHSRHRVRLFEQTRAAGLKEVAGWRDACA